MEKHAFIEPVLLKEARDTVLGLNSTSAKHMNAQKSRHASRSPASSPREKPTYVTPQHSTSIRKETLKGPLNPLFEPEAPAMKSQSITVEQIEQLVEQKLQQALQKIGIQYAEQQQQLANLRAENQQCRDTLADLGSIHSEGSEQLHLAHTLTALTFPEPEEQECPAWGSEQEQQQLTHSSTQQQLSTADTSSNQAAFSTAISSNISGQILAFAAVAGSALEAIIPAAAVLLMLLQVL